MVLCNAQCLSRRSAEDVCEPLLPPGFEIVDRGHWRFAHSVGGLPSLALSSFVACMASFVVAKNQSR